MLNNLLPRRFKIEFVDDNGGKVSLTMEGYVSKEQITHALDAVSSLSKGGVIAQALDADTTTVFGRVASLVSDLSSAEWVPSSLIRDAYARRYGTEIKPPVISTYLSRLSRMGMLERKGARNRRVYRLVKRADASA